MKVRHGRNVHGRLLHYYLNFSGNRQSFVYPYASGTDLLSKRAIARGSALPLESWDLAIVAETRP